MIDAAVPDPMRRLRALDAAEPAVRAVELRAMAVDGAVDDRVRAVALTLHAVDGPLDDEVILEPGAPPVVASAAEKAREIRVGRRLVARATAGEPLASAPFDAPVLAVTGEVSAAEVTQAADVADAVGRDRSGPDPTLVTCGRRAWAILVDRDLADPGRLRERPSHPASVASRDVVDDSDWSVTLEVITTPRDDGIAIAVIDRRGHARLVGMATSSDLEAIDFSLQAVDRPDARPVHIQGSLHAGRLELASVRRGSGVGQRLSPEPLTSRSAAGGPPHRRT